MFRGVNPKQMKAMMSKMGISQTEVDANRVVIEGNDGNIIIDNPQVMKVTMQGQESFQITGEVSEESSSGISQEDIQQVVEKTGKSEEEAKSALEKHKGDLAEAILELS